MKTKFQNPLPTTALIRCIDLQSGQTYHVYDSDKKPFMVDTTEPSCAVVGVMGGKKYIYYTATNVILPIEDATFHWFLPVEAELVVQQ